MADDSGSLPLSLSQREVWLDQLAWPESTHLNIGGAGFLSGPLDVELFKQALNLLVAESDALRLVPSLDGRQRLLEYFDARLELVDLRGSPDPRAAMRDWGRAWISIPFELGESPPWRIALLRGKDDLHAVIVQFHHLVMDGWSTSIFVQRCSELYNALAERRQPVDSQDASYLRYIRESNEYLGSSAFQRDSEFWRDQLPSLPEALFESRYKQEKQDALPDAHLMIEKIVRSDYDRLCQAAGASGTTAYHWALAAVAIYLALTMNRAEVVIGVPCLNRSGKRYKSTLGMFVGVLALRIPIDPQQRVLDVTASIAGRLRAIYRHPSYPLSEHVRALDAVRQGRESLFDALVSYERQDYTCHFGEAAASGAQQTFSGKARYGLGVTLCEFHGDEDVDLVLEASSVCFSRRDAALLGRRLSRLLSAMSANADQTLDRLPLMPDAERSSLLERMHREMAHRPDLQPFVRQFEHQAELFPDAVALVWNKGCMSYGELCGKAGRLADRLIDQGVERNAVVALAMDRGPEMVIALLAIAKAGAAFLPLDLEAPVARLADIVERSESAAFVAVEASRQRFASLSVLQITFESAFSDDDQPMSPGVRPPRISRDTGDIAYVIFTSGSTGRPKGVVVGQTALSKRLAWIARTWDVTADDCFGQATQVTFDPSLIELLVPLTQGASVALPPPGRLLPESLATFAIEHQVTVMAFVPSTLLRFLDGLGGRRGLRLRLACCGGEVLSPDLAERFSNETQAILYNVYGPSEAVIFATAWNCKSFSETISLPVGRSLDDTYIYVLDRRLQLLPYAVTGDIYIAGETLASGYLHRPDLDTAAFLPDPFHADSRMYRTGDIGWLDVHGELHFVGRNDRQIKLRGYRIELGEIEAAILSIEGVSQAAVKLVEAEGRQILHAWVAGIGSLTVDTLRKSLSGRLPDYMVPARFGLMPGLPTTATGKIDYAALKEIASSPPERHARQPSGEVERELLRIWSETLKRPNLNVYDDFFEQGGDSLAAVTLLAAIEARFGTRLGLHQLVENPNVAAMAEVIHGELGLPGLMISLGTTSRNATMYLAASGHGDLIRFRALAQAMGWACDLRMLQPPGDAHELDISKLATLYADRIEADGDRIIFIAGFSVGGLAALETARILEQRGIEVRELFLVDTVLVKVPFGGFFIWRLLAWIGRHSGVFNFTVNGRHLAYTLNDEGLHMQVKAMRGYRPPPYSKPALLIKSSGLMHFDRWLFGPWRRLIGEHLAERVMPGVHGTMFEAGNIDSLAAILVSRVCP